METIVPYFNFNGNAAEASTFYSKALDRKILYKQTFGESLMPSADAMKDKIMHVAFQADHLLLMVSDCTPEMSVTSGSNINLSLNFKEAAAIDKTYAAFSEGAKITLELQDTFWKARFGMRTNLA